MAGTSREEIIATYRERAPLRNETLIEYGIFLSDAFGSGPITQSFFDDSTVPANIDGFDNDDAYRASRHYALRKAEKSTPVRDQLRESSLARQLMEKKDQSATIRLIRRVRPGDSGGNDPSKNTSKTPWVHIIPPNTKFFLERVSENREEKVQITDTFGEWIAFFFGRRPEVYSYSGTLLNAKNHDWKNEFQENYENFLRGTQAVKHRATMFLQYDDVVVEGFMLNCNLQMNAIQDKAVPFSFNLLVINRSPLSPGNLLAMRFARTTLTASEQQLFKDMSAALDLTKTGNKSQQQQQDDQQTFLLMREFFAGNYIPPSGTAVNYANSGAITSQDSVPPGVNGGLVKTAPISERISFTGTNKLTLDQFGSVTGQ